MADTASVRRRRTRRRRMIASGAAVVVIGGGSAVAVAATSGDGPGMETAAVRLASITQIVESSGTITSVRKVSETFSVSGTVASVQVKVGQHVARHQVLAKLDTSSLRADVDSAQSTLASARQRLASDKSGQTQASSSTGTAQSGSSVTTDAYTSSKATPPTITLVAAYSTTTLQQLIKQIETAQQSVIDSQKAIDEGQAAVDKAQAIVDADIKQNTVLRDAQKSACATPTAPTSAPSGSSAPSGGTSQDCDDAQGAYEGYADTLSAANAVLDQKIAAQDDAIDSLDQGIATLDGLIAKLQSVGSGGGSSTPSSPSPSSPAPSGSGSGPSSVPASGPSSQPNPSPSGSASQAPGASTSTGSMPTSGTQSQSSNATTTPSTDAASGARLASDQAGIDSAKAQLKLARQNLAATTLRSSIAGKVAEVDLSAGSSSSGNSITVVGTGAEQVSITVPLTQIDLIHKGEHVTVTADGQQRRLHGTVTQLGKLSSSSDSITSFPVTVRLARNSTHVVDGTGAQVDITAATAHRVLAIPNSAIHSGFGGQHQVTVTQGGTTSAVQVTLGVSGTALTQVVKGLSKGQQVVLADPSQTLPSSSTSGSTGGFATRFTGGLNGGFPALSNFGGGR